MALKLNQQMTELLKEVIRKRCPHLTKLLGSLQDLELTESQRDELFDATGDEFLETGLREDDTPNERGLLLEDLIGRLRHP